MAGAERRAEVLALGAGLVLDGLPSCGKARLSRRRRPVSEEEEDNEAPARLARRSMMFCSAVSMEWDMGELCTYALGDARPNARHNPLETL